MDEGTWEYRSDQQGVYRTEPVKGQPRLLNIPWHGLWLADQLNELERLRECLRAIRQADRNCDCLGDFSELVTAALGELDATEREFDSIDAGPVRG